MKKHFRIVPCKTIRGWWRVDERHSLLFGLIKYWDYGSASMSPNYNYRKRKLAQRSIIDKFPKGELLITGPDKEIMFYRKG